MPVLCLPAAECIVKGDKSIFMQVFYVIYLLCIDVYEDHQRMVGTQNGLCPLISYYYNHL